MSADVVLEVIYHDDPTPWAEWDLFEDGELRCGCGTAPSFEAAIDAAVNAWNARFHDRSAAVSPGDGDKQG